MSKSTKVKFPPEIMVRREEPVNDESYLTIEEGGLDAIDQEQDVAIYRLHKVSRVQITKELAD